jgi:hypothetical protein
MRDFRRAVCGYREFKSNGKHVVVYLTRLGPSVSDKPDNPSMSAKQALCLACLLVVCQYTLL